MKKFGIYVHLPFCIQKCSYCDFSTASWQNGAEEDHYIQLLLREIEAWSNWVGPRKVNTLYFGGGTPSLISAKNILSIINCFEKYGFDLSDLEEVSLEIDPGTINKDKLYEFLDLGITRFSVGIQSFDDSYLKKVGRLHTGSDSKQLLQWVNELEINYTADLLFGVSGQTMDQLKKDLQHLKDFQPTHISAYVLTVPDGHVLTRGQPSDELIVDMFKEIRESLADQGIIQYELSNYAKPGEESKHNLIYWNDHEFWGVGMSAHSYFKKDPWGLRFWNPKTLRAYDKWVKQTWNTNQFVEHFSSSGEYLEAHQSLFDYLHTRLRLVSGLKMEDLEEKYGAKVSQLVVEKFQELHSEGLMHNNKDQWRVSDEGRFMFNKVLEELTFSSNKVDSLTV